MLEREFLVCNIVSGLGHIRGRKKFQKMMYIAKSLGYPVPEDFIWGNYGVYSSELQSELDALAENGLIKEENVSSPGNPPEYEYSIEREGVALMARLAPLMAQGPEQTKSLSCLPGGLSSIIDQSGLDLLLAFLKRMNKEKVDNLELWSSILYLRDSEKDEKALVSFLHYLKPHFVQARIERGIGEVKTLEGLSYRRTQDQEAGRA